MTKQLPIYFLFTQLHSATCMYKVATAAGVFRLSWRCGMATKTAQTIPVALSGLLAMHFFHHLREFSYPPPFFSPPSPIFSTSPHIFHHHLAFCTHHQYFTITMVFVPTSTTARHRCLLFHLHLGSTVYKLPPARLPPS